jgi:hypothetical protein
MLMNNPFVSRLTLISFYAIAQLYEKNDAAGDCSLGSESHVSWHKTVRYKNQIQKIELRITQLGPGVKFRLPDFARLDANVFQFRLKVGYLPVEKL